MGTQTITIITILTLLAPSIVSAHDSLSKEFSQCMEHSGGTTVTMLDCIKVETAKQDLRLNNAYKELSSTLSEERLIALRDVQRAWIKYRDLSCGFYNDPNAGTLAVVRANDCYMSETARRADKLEGHIL